jgi:2-hydroxychromene-2-carboxylate isomerase
MVSKKFEVLFDVGGPNSYLVHKILPRFCAEHDAEAELTPILLGGLFKATGNRAPMIRYADAPAKLAYENLEFQRFIKTHNLTQFRMNPHFPVNSLLCMRVLTGAGRAGVLLSATDALMAGMWEDGLDLGKAEVVAECLTAAGLDGAALAASAEDPDVKAELVATTEKAVERGAFGVPTFFVGTEMFWGKERLPQVAAKLAKG